MSSIININTSLKDLLAEARAIYFAMKNGALTYKEAKRRTEPLLGLLNTRNRQIARKFRVKAKEIRFSDLNRSL